jgi:hypothetical protein
MGRGKVKVKGKGQGQAIGTDWLGTMRGLRRGEYPRSGAPIDVESQRVRFWGCGGWEASPTRKVTNRPSSEERSRRRAPQARVPHLTATKKQQNSTTNMSVVSSKPSGEVRAADEPCTRPITCRRIRPGRRAKSAQRTSPEIDRLPAVGRSPRSGRALQSSNYLESRYAASNTAPAGSAPRQ